MNVSARITGSITESVTDGDAGQDAGRDAGQDASLDAGQAAVLDRGHGIVLAGAALVADPAGALYWEQERLLIVADLHLEKGSSFARRGSLLPPYDSADTLARLAGLIGRWQPRAVLALGDNFHDGEGSARLEAGDRATLLALLHGRDVIWITGNHDPEPMPGIPGAFVDTLNIGALVFRHAPTPAPTPAPTFAAATDAGPGEICGHLHPVAVVSARGRALRRRCFVSNGRRLVMPAFGAYAGGLNVRHRAFAAVIGQRFTAHVIGDARVHAFPASACIGG